MEIFRKFNQNRNFRIFENFDQNRNFFENLKKISENLAQSEIFRKFQ